MNSEGSRLQSGPLARRPRVYFSVALLAYLACGLIVGSRALPSAIQVFAAGVGVSVFIGYTVRVTIIRPEWSVFRGAAVSVAAALTAILVLTILGFLGANGIIAYDSGPVQSMLSAMIDLILAGVLLVIAAVILVVFTRRFGSFHSPD